MTATDPLTLPPLPQSGTTGTAIGIPQGYVAPTHFAPPPAEANWPASSTRDGGLVTPYGTSPHGKTYTEGDQWKPQNFPPHDVYSLQQQLATAGVLSPTNLRPGVWDTSSADAYKTVLGFANATGMSVTDALKVMVNNPQLQAKSQRAPFQMTAPADITAQVSGGGAGKTNVARELVGHDLPASETGDFLKWYQDQEANARKQYMVADLAGPGNSYTGAPNLQAAAQQYIKDHNLGESVAYGTASRMLSFFQLLKGVV